MATQLSNGASFEALFDSYLGLGVPKAGEIRDGYIVAVRNSAILVDIAAKSEGVIPGNEIDAFSKQQKSEMTV
ncbi:MAG: S1 RNA-binding domain-containing protein, partial [Candidatus Promineifilaceae bacterium]